MSFCYVVVEFLEEEAVEVIHNSWLHNSSDSVGQYCYWPRFNSSAKAKKGDIPDKRTWKLYKIRVLGGAYSYERAVQKANRKLETSSIESDADGEETAIGRRIIKKPSRFLTDESEADDEADSRKNAITGTFHFGSTSAKLPVPPAPKLSLKHGIQQSGDSQYDDRSPTTSKSPDTTPAKRRITMSYPRSPSSGSSRSPQSPHPKKKIRGHIGSVDSETQENNFSKILLRLQSLEEGQNRILKLLNSLTSQKDVEDLEDLIPEKLDSLDDMDDLNERLTREKDFKKKLLAFLISLGGATVGETVRRILRRLATNSLWSLYSLRGRKGKKPFIDLQIARLIIRACLKNHSKAKQADIEQELAEGLKHAPKKKGGPKYKETAERRNASDSE